jgi:Gpi18-like mannosyltransferase
MSLSIFLFNLDSKILYLLNLGKRARERSLYKFIKALIVKYWYLGEIRGSLSEVLGFRVAKMILLHLEFGFIEFWFSGIGL